MPKIGKGISVACNNNPTIAFKSSELFHIHVHVKTWVGKVWVSCLKETWKGMNRLYVNEIVMCWEGDCM